MANQPNLGAALADASKTLAGMAQENRRAAEETRARAADMRSRGWDDPTDGSGVRLDAVVADCQEKATRYDLGARAAANGYLMTGRRNGNDLAWVQQFGALMPRAMREERCVNPDLPHVDLQFYIRGPVT
jgi:hypothetical protein